MITQQFADSFAKDWIDAWNDRDLSRILAHYHDDFIMSSPKIAAIAKVPSGVLYGKDKVAEYWSKALSLIPELRFELIDTFIGADSIIIYYQSINGLVTEVFFFDGSGLVVRAAANY